MLAMTTYHITSHRRNRCRLCQACVSEKSYDKTLKSLNYYSNILQFPVVVVLLYSLVCTRLQHSKNIQSCIASLWKSNTDNKTLLLLKWSLRSIIHRKYKTHDKNISSKVCECYMSRLTLSKNSNSASLTIVLYRLFTLLSTDGDNNNASVIMELLFCFVVMPEWYIKLNISFRSYSYLLQWSKKCSVVSNACPQSHIGVSAVPVL